MIIRTSPAREYTALPNSIFRDRQLTLEAKGLLGYLLSLPPSWEVRPGVITKALSPEKGRPLGKDRLRRMFHELIAAGYMARSEAQTKDSDGFFGAYIYIVGADAAAVEAEADATGVAFLPQAGLPSTDMPSTANPPPYKRTKERNYTKKEIEDGDGELNFIDASIEQESKRPPRQEAKRPVSPNKERPEVIQARIANRLGSNGWAILMDMSATEIDQITAQERMGRLTEEHLADLRWDASQKAIVRKRKDHEQGRAA